MKLTRTDALNMIKALSEMPRPLDPLEDLEIGFTEESLTETIARLYAFVEGREYKPKQITFKARMKRSSSRMPTGRE
jgi:hypothetical protein